MPGLFLPPAQVAVTSAVTSTTIAQAAIATASGYGGAIAPAAVNLTTITANITTILVAITPAFPNGTSPVIARLRPENCQLVFADITSITSAIASATTQSVASAGLPSPTFPAAAQNVVVKLQQLTQFIQEKFVNPQI